MGKFFIGGAFLGAAVTWAVMAFVVPYFQPKMYTQEQLDEQVDLKAREVRKETEAAKGREWQDKLDAQVGTLEEKLRTTEAEGERKIAGLTGDKKELETELADARVKVESLTTGVADRQAVIDDLRARAAGPSMLPGLVESRTELLPATPGLWRSLGEVMSVLAQAEHGWPNVELARKANKELSEVAGKHRKHADAVRAYILQSPTDIQKDLAKSDLKPYLFGVEKDRLDAIDKLVEKIKSAVESLKYDAETVVSAEKEGWTDTNVLVAEGDVIQVRAEGIWSMQESWEPRGPEGWDAGSHFKIYHRARAGGLILRIGVSEKMHAAYLGKPIHAETSGRVLVRINDTDVKDNDGKVRAHVVAASPKALKSVVRAWNRIIGRK